MTTYKVTECYVLHLDAGNDRNGNPRRCYVLCHPLDGMLAATDEGFAGWGAIGDLPVVWADGNALDIYGDSRKQKMINALSERMPRKIDTSPSYRNHLLRTLGLSATNGDIRVIVTL